MSVAANGAIRCDECGKLTSNQDGEYTKPDGVSAGYMRPADGDNDICEECEA